MQLPGPLRDLLYGRGSSPAGGSPQGAGGSAPSRRAASAESTTVRPSRGMEEFFGYIRNETGLTLLDLGGASQQNVSFITNLGHRLYSEDFVRLLDETFKGDESGEQANPGRIDFLLKQTLDYPDAHFNGALVWDVLEYLSPPLLTAVVDRLRKLVLPNSYLLAFFHSDVKLESVPTYSFRIQNAGSLEVVKYGMHRPPQLFNNRGLEKLFADYASVKFFLAKDGLREVIIKV